MPPVVLLNYEDIVDGVLTSLLHVEVLEDVEIFSSVFLAMGGDVVRNEIETVCIILFASCLVFVSVVLIISSPVLTHNCANFTLLVIMGDIVDAMCTLYLATIRLRNVSVVRNDVDAIFWEFLAS